MDRNELDKIVSQVVDMFSEDENFTDLIGGLVGCIICTTRAMATMLIWLAAQFQSENQIKRTLEMSFKLLEAVSQSENALKKIVHEAAGDTGEVQNGGDDGLPGSGQDDAG